MMSVAMTSGKDLDTSQILIQNKNLLVELQQCQADKEFVWSLWKRLQISNPDVTEAISLAIQREKEKSEYKDGKVLEILQNKDDRVEELLSKISKQSTELKDSLSKRVDLQEDNGRLEAERNHLQDKVSTLEVQIRALETREKSFEEIHRKTLEATEREKQELQRRTNELTKELDIVRNEKSDHLTTRIQVEANARSFEREVAEKNVKIERLIQDLEECERIIQQYGGDLRSTKDELQYKIQELEIISKELYSLRINHSELTEYSSQQAALNQQLQALQNDTQQMVKNQEAAYSLESHSVQQIYGNIQDKYEILKKCEADLRQQVTILKKEILDKESIINQLRDKVDMNIKSLHQDMGGSFIDGFKDGEPVLDYEYKVECMKKEIDCLRHKLMDKERNFENSFDQSIEFDVSKLNRGEQTHSTPSRDYRSVATSPIRLLQDTRTRTKARSRSCSPIRNPRDGSVNHLLNTRKKLDDTEHLLQLKTKELNELRKVHNKRLERFKTLQANYKIIKDQLKSIEDDQYNSHKRKKLRRSDPKTLTKEDSDSVWNELAYFKRENRNLGVDRMTMQEDIDMLRVQASHDAAAIHELQIAFEQEREEHHYELKKVQFDNKDRTEIESELKKLKSELENKEILMRKLEKDVREVNHIKDLLIDEKRNLKSELLTLKRETADYRMHIANLKRDTSRLKRELDENNQSSKMSEKETEKSLSPDSFQESKSSRQIPKLPVYRINKRKARTKPSKQYQRSLNKSIEKMKSIFNNFNEDGWEEVSESAEVEDTDLTGSDTLGEAIVMASHLPSNRPSTTDTNRTSSSCKSNSSGRQKCLRQRLVRTMTIRRIAGGSQPSSEIRSSESPESVTESSSNERIPRVVTREMATSPITISPSKLSNGVKQMDYRYNTPPSRQLGPLKQRVNYLQQQVNTLRESRANALKTVGEQKETIQQLQSDLHLSNQRLKMIKLNVQKVTNDLEKLQKDKSDLESQISAREDSSSTTVSSLNDKRNDQEWKVLESKLKASSLEVSRQSATIKALKTENEQLQDQVRKLSEKINHSERDNNQKRTLVESQRTKLKNLTEKVKTDAETIVELETKIKLLNEGSEKTKTQMDSLKKRISAVSKDKKDIDQTNLNLLSDIDKTIKQLNDSTKKYTNLESAMMDLEQTAKEQLHELASQSEMAIDSVQTKLIDYHEKVLKYEQFVKMLSCELLSRVDESRREIQIKLTASQRAKEPVDPTLEQAKAIAQDLFNLSQSDIEELMNDDSDPKLQEANLAQKKLDKKWIKKCERTLHSKEFVLPLVEMMVEKMDERSELIKQAVSTK